MTIKQPVLAVVCVCILGCILIAGLWPFFPPTNDVHWLNYQNGLLFGSYATILSSNALIPQDSGAGSTVELWLQPGLSFDSSSIFDIYTEENPFQFRIGQSGDDLEILRDRRAKRGFERNKFYVDHVFRQGRQVLITLTGGAEGTSIYSNGELMKSVPQFKLMNQDLRGDIVIGAAPVEDDRWSGRLLGLAIYSVQLSPKQVSRHYREWTSGHPSVAVDEHAEALYAFTERKGSVVRSQVDTGPDLYIPRHFTVVDKAFLMPPWKEFSPHWNYYKYIVINITGFIPLGFFFCAYFSFKVRRSEATLNTILTGTGISLIIEVLQAYIPTRQSGVTDLITNTVGTAVGVTLFRSAAVQPLVSKLFEPKRPTTPCQHHHSTGPIWPDTSFSPQPMQPLERSISPID